MLNPVILVAIAAIIFFAWFLYLIKVENHTNTEALQIIISKIKHIYKRIIGWYAVYQKRSAIFAPYQDIRPYEETIKNLHVCKYFKFSHTVETYQDILELRFDILGISSEYKENIKGLAILFEKLLQDFYVERLGNLHYPLVHAIHIQEGEAVFWVAKNAYGNQKIQERAYLDERKDRPNMKDLKANASHKPVKIGYDLTIWEKYGTRLTVCINLPANIHWLVCGNSGSGKSYFILLALQNILTEFMEDVKIWFCDFKSSDDFSFMKNYPRYYSGGGCARGLEEFYSEFQQVKDGSISDGRLRLLFFDEWAGFMVYETQQNKKQAEQYKGYLLEILLMGRSMLCGVMVILQRNDVKFLEGRDQFFVTVAFGKLNTDFKRMVMQGEELEQREAYSQGEGIVKTGSGTKFLKVPKLQNIEHTKRQIMACLTQADDAKGGGGEASGDGTPTA